jgi:hypothetical protein
MTSIKKNMCCEKIATVIYPAASTDCGIDALVFLNGTPEFTARHVESNRLYV